MKLWMTATLAVITAGPLALGATIPAPQGSQGPSNPTTASYELVVYDSSSAASQTASKGASYGRIDEVGSVAAFVNTPSLDSAAYFALTGVFMTESTPSAFEMLTLAPSAGFPLTSVTIPVTLGLSGSLTVRFDGILASQNQSANPNLVKASAPLHTPGPVDVTVEGATKTITFESGFAYVPALDTPAEIALGQHVQVRVYGTPGASFWIMYSPALGAPTPMLGVEGTLDLDFASLLPLGQVIIPSVLPGGATTHEGFFEFEMPKNPEMLGKTYFIQAATIDPNLSTSPFAFTNHTAITVKN